MSGLEIVGLALGIVPLLVETVKNPGLLSDFINYHVLDDWSNLDTQTRRREKIVAKLRTSLLQACFPSVWHQMTIIEKCVLPGGDEIAEQFRVSYVSDCNMSAVAGAIIAQVAITSLSLPNISRTHWVARAFFITSLISGCFAVYFACWSQKTIGTLFKANDLKDWLTRRESVPLSGWSIRRRLKQLEKLKKTGDKTNTGLTVGSKGDVEKGFLDDFNHLQEWQRSVSVWSAFLLQAPFMYMKLSLGSFVLGLAVYTGFVWTRNLDEEAGKDDSRNIFIVLLVVVVFCIYSYVGPALYKGLEVLPVQRWKEYQDKLNDFADSQARFLAKGTQEPSLKSPDQTKSSKNQRASKSSTYDTEGISTLDELPFSTPACDQASALGSSDSSVAQLISALKESTSAQAASNNSIRILRMEVADLAAAIRKRDNKERGFGLSNDPT